MAVLAIRLLPAICGLLSWTHIGGPVEPTGLAPRCTHLRHRVHSQFGRGTFRSTAPDHVQPAWISPTRYLKHRILWGVSVDCVRIQGALR